MYLNLSFYVLSDLSDLEGIAEKLQKIIEDFELKGTILVAKEGINANLCTANPCTEFKEQTFREALEKAHPSFVNLWIKKSFGDIPSFDRCEVKLKKQVLSFRVSEPPSPNKMLAGARLSPKDFGTKIDEIKKILSGQDDSTIHPEQIPIVVDTRNQYEFDYGNFDTSISLGIEHFSEFVPEFKRRFDAQKDREFLLYCTGGIRCEKLVANLQAEGFKNAKQLDGGILGYFEQEKDRNYTGDCFVFDYRWAVTPFLKQSIKGPHPRQLPKIP